MTGGYWGSTLEGGGVTVQGSGWKQQWGGCHSPGRLHEVREGGADVWGGVSQWWWCQGSGWCHAGVAAGGVSLGWPGGPCCSEGCPAMLPCPAAGRWEGGCPWAGVGGKLFQERLSRGGGDRAGQRPSPRRGQQGRAWRGSREPQLTPRMLCIARAALPRTPLLPRAPRRARPPPRRVLETGLSPRAGGKWKGWAKGLGGPLRCRCRCRGSSGGIPGAKRPGRSWQWGGGGRGLCPPCPVLRSLSMRVVGRGVAGGCPPPVPSWPSRRSPRRRPGEGSGGGGGGWAGCPRCRCPPRAGPAFHRGSVGMAVRGVGAGPMHPVPPSQHSPSPGDPRGTQLPATQPEGTNCRAVLSLALGTMPLPPGAGADAAQALSSQPPGLPTPTGVPDP